MQQVCASNGVMNTCTKLVRHNSTGVKVTPHRLSPRVMVGVELNILKPGSGTSSAASSRHVSPVLPRSGVSSSRASTQGSDRSVSPPRISSGSRSGKVSSKIEVISNSF